MTPDNDPLRSLYALAFIEGLDRQDRLAAVRAADRAGLLARLDDTGRAPVVPLRPARG